MNVAEQLSRFSIASCLREQSFGSLHDVSSPVIASRGATHRRIGRQESAATMFAVHPSPEQHDPHPNDSPADRAWLMVEDKAVGHGTLRASFWPQSNRKTWIHLQTVNSISLPTTRQSTGCPEFWQTRRKSGDFAGSSHNRDEAGRFPRGNPLGYI